MNKIYEEDLPQGKFEIYNDKPQFDLHYIHQIHSTKIVHLDNLDIQSDGIIFKLNGPTHPISIKTADCMPIILFGNTHGCFLHAGWRGLADGILENQLLKDIQPHFAFIGPAIHSCHFEVQEDFISNFKGSEHFLQKNDKLYFDLQKEACDILKRVFSKIKIRTSNICTHCDNNYNSFRRDKTSKRNWNIWTI